MAKPIPFAKHNLELLMSLTMPILPADDTEEPWLRDFMSGYSGAFLAVIAPKGTAQVSGGVDSYPRIVTEADPSTFLYRGNLAGKEDAKNFSRKGDRSCSKLREFVAHSAKHRDHWQKHQHEPAWQAHERQWDHHSAEFDKMFGDS